MAQLSRIFQSLFPVPKPFDASASSIQDSQHTTTSGGYFLDCCSSSQKLSSLRSNFTSITSRVVEALDQRFPELAKYLPAPRLKTSAVLENICNAVPDAIVLADLNGIIRYCNATVLSLYGTDTPDALIGRHIIEFVAEEERSAAQANLVELLQGEVHEDLEHTLIKSDGSRITGKIFARLVDNPRGDPDTLILKLEDITEQKATERALHVSEMRYREMFLNMHSCVAVYRAEEHDDGTISFVFEDFNPAAEKTEAISREKLIGRDVTEVFPGVKEMGLLAVFERVYRTGKAKEYPTAMYEDQRIKGWRFNQVYKLPGGEIVAIYEDKTEEKRVEKERDRALELASRNYRYAAMAQGAAAVAHEINNVLGVLSSINEMNKMALKDIEPYLKSITRDYPMLIPFFADFEENNNLLKNTINRLCDMAKTMLDLGRKNAVPEKFSPNSAIHVALLLAKPRFSKNSIAWKVDLDESDPPSFGMKGEFMHGMLNLFANAIDATPNGGSIRVISRKIKKGIVIKVSDTGHGIPDDIKERIFDPFFTTKSAKTGTGLGMSIAKDAIESMGGRISLKSKVGSGTTFTVLLPLADKD